MPERIDAFAHVMPKPVLDRVVEVVPDSVLGRFREQPRFWDVATRLAVMDEYGIDRQVLTLSHSAIWNELGKDEALHVTRLANDEVAGLVEDRPDRFVAVATLPRLTGAYLDELDRCLDDLGMAGVQIFTNIDGRPLDDETFRPFYDRVGRAEAPIWLHPLSHAWYPWMDSFESRAFGWPFETTLALTRLVRGGILDDHPELEVIGHHMGGMIPHFSARLQEFHEMEEGEHAGDLAGRFTRLYADTVLGGSDAALTCGRGFFDDHRILYATDYPFGPERGVGRVRGITESVGRIEDAETRAAIFGGNARRLLA